MTELAMHTQMFRDHFMHVAESSKPRLSAELEEALVVNVFCTQQRSPQTLDFKNEWTTLPDFTFRPHSKALDAGRFNEL